MDSNKPQKVVLAGVALLAVGAGAYWLGSHHRDNAGQSDAVALGSRRVRTEEPEVVKTRPGRKGNGRKVDTSPRIRRIREPRERPKNKRRPKPIRYKEPIRRRDVPPGC